MFNVCLTVVSSKGYSKGAWHIWSRPLRSNILRTTATCCQNINSNSEGWEDLRCFGLQAECTLCLNWMLQYFKLSDVQSSRKECHGRVCVLFLPLQLHVVESVIQDCHPGEVVFDPSRYQCLFSYPDTLTLAACSFVPGSGYVDRYLASAEAGSGTASRKCKTSGEL